MIRKILRGSLFLLPVLFLLPQLGAIPFGRGQIYSDLLVSHYPNALYLQRVISDWGTIPLWSSTILSGYPFAANPLSGLFYPPGWIALLFPLPAGLNVLIVLHLIWAGVGMYFLLREEGLGELSSLFGALAFESLPKLFAHLGAGHLTLIYAVAWTPWLLYSERRIAASAGARVLIPGAVLGMIALADVRWAAYSGLFWLAYAGWTHWKVTRTERTWLPWLFKMAGKVLFGLLIAAPLLVPMGEYVRFSTRSLLTPGDSLFLSLPLAHLFGLAIPAIGGAAEWVVYAGAVVFLLVVFSASYRPARTRAAFWLVSIPLTLLFALGANLPFIPFIFGLPGLSLLRVPPRIVFLTGLCLCAAAAVGLDTLTKRSKNEEAENRDRSRLALFAVTTFVGLFAAAVILTLRGPELLRSRIQFGWAAVVMVIAATLIFALRARKIPATSAGALLLGLALLDSISLNGLSLEFQPFSSVVEQEADTVQFLQSAQNGAPYRIYSPSYSLPQHTAAYYGFELANGADPLQLSAYVEYMELATGVTAQRYSVTLPAFLDGDPLVDNRAAVPDARLLGLLNVRYVVSAFPISAQGLQPRWKSDTVYIYENQLFMPRAWVQREDVLFGSEYTGVTDLASFPNQISMIADGPGLLVLSEIAYPGWRVEVDGVSATLETVDGVFRGVRLDSGSHRVRFTFRPWTVYLGILIGLAAWLGWVAALTKPWRPRD